MLWLVLLLAVTMPFAAGALIGAPYVPILDRDRRKALDLAGLKPGQTLIDLGSGDGRLLRAAAARGIRGIGYEVNPWLVFISRLVGWRYRQLITIHTADFWHTKLPAADAVYFFLLDRYTTRLAAKFEAEITRPTKVIAYIFELPGHTPVQRTRNTYVYEFGHEAKTQR